MKLEFQPKAEKILEKLHKAGFRAFFVGGAPRDLLLGKTPKDWDIATSAKPEEIQKLFPKHFYDNRFGTVTVLPSKVEITTFRKESKYTDKRHPDEVIFTDSLEEDLKRRDFTVNALATDGKEVIGDQEDLKKRLIRAVGEPDKRFQEDALRLIRAIRFAVQLDFEIEEKTEKSIFKNHKLLELVAKERIRDEFVKIVNSDSPQKGIEFLRKLKLLQFVAPELEYGVGVGQNKHHTFEVFEHCIKALEAAKDHKFGSSVRLASLFHDIGKPKTKEGDGENSTFHNHDIVGAKITRKIMERLRFDRETSKKVVKLVRYHMFLSDPDKVTEAGARRLIRKVGKENMKELLELRIADRIGSGVPKARPWRLRSFEYMLDKVSRDPIDVKMLKIDGNEVMRILQMKPEKRVGLLLRALLNEVIDDPKKNTKKYLKDRVVELNKLDDKTLEANTKELDLKSEEKELLEKRRFGV
jgi:putative nucleotidyltransferase with HDIG domain